MRTALTLVATALVVAATAASATAAAPTRVTFNVDETFYAPGTSAACGLDAWITARGTITVSAFSDRDGSIARELDVERFTLTFTSSAGKSFAFTRDEVLHWTYPEDVAIGSVAEVVTTGHLANAAGPGSPTTAGRVVERWIVVDFTRDGIPLAEPIEGVSLNGHFVDEETFMRARCAALGGSLQ
jgi:hypothetical protein